MITSTCMIQAEGNSFGELPRFMKVLMMLRNCWIQWPAAFACAPKRLAKREDCNPDLLQGTATLKLSSENNTEVKICFCCRR